MSSKSASLLLATAVLLGPVDLMAQRGHGGVGRTGVHGGSYSGSVPAAHSVPAARPATPNLGGRPFPIRTDIPTPIGLNAPAASYTGILPGAYKSQVHTGGHYGRGGGALIAPPLYYPYLGFDPSLNTFPSYSETIDPNAQAFAAAQESLGQQIQQLTAELDSVKRQMSAPAPFAPPPVPPNPPATAPDSDATDSTSQQPPVAVVLKNGQRLSVQSYAVMNGMLWDFSRQPVRKIPVSSIDVPESVKASEANGTEFPDLSSAARANGSH